MSHFGQELMKDQTSRQSLMKGQQLPRTDEQPMFVKY